jgi:hypothetical protein
MHKSATKCNETLGKWCKNKHGASKIMDALETYQVPWPQASPRKVNQGVGPFILLDGLLSHEKVIDQTTSLQHGEFFVFPLAATSGAA